MARFHLQETSRRATPHRQKVGSWCLGAGGVGWGVTAHADRVSFWRDEKVLEPDRGGGIHNIMNVLSAAELYVLKGEFYTM